MAQLGSDTESYIATAAGRYALALFGVALEAGSIDKVEADLATFGGFIQESRDLRLLITSPVFTSGQQERAIAAILEKAGMNKTTTDFLRLVAKKGRLSVLPEIIRLFRDRVRVSRGIVRAEVSMAEEPSAKTLSSITATLKETAGAEVDVTVKIDPNLIGGLIVQMGSRMMDASVRTKLNSIRLAMKEVR